MRDTISSLILSLPVLLLVGCGETIDDYLEAEGTYGDGQALQFHERVQRVVCDASKREAPCISMVALRLGASDDDVLRGLRINFTPSQVSPQQPYSSGLIEPVTVYAIQTSPEKLVDRSINGGTLTFTSIATGPGQMTSGTFTDMVLVRPDDDGVEETMVTLTRGTFQYYQP